VPGLSLECGKFEECMAFYMTDQLAIIYCSIDNRFPGIIIARRKKKKTTQLIN
jgi:hypothetical protein